MVRILSIAGICFLVLSIATIGYYKQYNYSGICRYRVLTSNSFHSGIAEVFKEKFKEKHDCEIYFAVVNGANLISNLFNKQPNQYDLLIGIDRMQVNKIPMSYIKKLSDEELLKYPQYKNSFFVYDEAPLTFFLRHSKVSHFQNLKNFIQYLETNDFTVAVPLNTTSIIGSMFEKWVKHENLVEFIANSRRVKFVKSWSEAFGLFERKIVDGFLSFETSEIYFLNSKEVVKIEVDEGHPNLQEYFAFSSKSKITDLQKKEMVDFIYSKEIQELLLKENYMWPINIKEHDYAELRTLKTLKDL